MGFDINGFKNNFLNQLLGAANSEIKNNKIDRGTSEISKANQVVSTFKSQLEGISNPIGDMTSFSTKNEVTTDDLLAFVDPEIADKVQNYIATKPVQTIRPAQTPAQVSQMANLADDVDVNKLNAFLDMAFASNVADRISASVVDAEPEDMKTGFFVGMAYDIDKA